MTQTLGFIGLGNMGSRLANNIFKDNGNLLVWDRTRDKLTEYAPLGSSLADSITELVASSDVTFISISNDAAMKEVVEEICKQNLANKIIVDFSTITPETSRELADRIADKGGRMLDSPVSGSTPQVEARALTIFVGGSRDTFESVRSCIEPLGRATHYMGENGSGLKMKLAVNLLLGVGIASLAESLVLAQKLGIEKTAAIEALSGTAVLSPSQTAKLELAKKDDYAEATFSLELMHKDLGLVLDEAKKQNITLGITEAAKQLADSSMPSADADFAVMIQTAEQSAGLEK